MGQHSVVGLSAVRLSAVKLRAVKLRAVKLGSVSRGPVRRLAGWALAASVLIGGMGCAPEDPSGAPDVAVGVADPHAHDTYASAPAEIAITGRVAAVPSEMLDGEVVMGGLALITVTGGLVELDPAGSEREATGSIATVTFAVPGIVRESVDAALSERGGEVSHTEMVELILEVVGQEHVGLDPLAQTDDGPRVTAVPTPDEAGDDEGQRVAGLAHTIDVLYVENSEAALPAEGEITKLIERMSDYWSEQTNGQISAVQAGDILIERDGFDTSLACDLNFGTWHDAGERFDRTLWDYTKDTRHLLVMVSADTCGVLPGWGFGMIGEHVNSSGAMWAIVDPTAPLDWDGVVFHEFGHNISLGHSNLLTCAEDRFDSAAFDIDGAPMNADCTVTEYGDAVDMMGLTYGYGGMANTRDLAALSLTHREHLGVMPEASIALVTLDGGATQTVALQALTAQSGVRGARITDPSSSATYYLEYRAGTGRDSDAIYKLWADYDMGLEFGYGVRVLRQVPMAGNMTSLVMQRPLTASELVGYGDWRAPLMEVPYLAPGSVFDTDGGGMSVRVVSMDESEAVVEITLR